MMVTRHQLTNQFSGMCDVCRLLLVVATYRLPFGGS